MKMFLSILFSVVGFINAALFIFWLSLVHIALSGADQKQYVYNNIAADLTVLEVILAVIAVGAIFAALFAYFSLRDGLLKVATHHVDEYMKEKAPGVIKHHLATLDK